MRKYRRIKRSFTAGEVSPYLEGRTGADTFINGCKTLKNMVVLPEGPVVRRPGFMYFSLIRNLYSSIIFFEGTDGSQYLLGISWTTYYPPELVVIGVYSHNSSFSPGDELLRIEWIGSRIFTSYVLFGDALFLADGATPLVVISYSSYSSWTLTNPTLTGAPFNSIYGYPYFVFFHQQRLGLARTYTRPQGVWLSKVNDFYNFDITNTNADDPVSFQLDSDINSKIQWVLSGRSLFIGTDDDEWTVRGGGSSLLITPTSVLAQRHTNIGSEQIKSLGIAHTQIFVEQLGRAVYEMLYDMYSDTYTTNDLIILSKHLTEQYKIVDWAYQQVPHKILWAVREDGTLLSLTYQREHKVIGWAHHNIKKVDGSTAHVVNIVSGKWTTYYNVHPIYSEHVIFVTTKDEIIYCLGPWAYENGGDPPQDLSNWIFLDDSERFIGYGFSQVNTKHFFIGDTVSVLTDKGVHRDVTIGDSYLVTLDYPCNVVILGARYTPEVRPIAIDIDTREGTTIGATQQVVEVDIILYKTQGLYIQRFNENGEVAQEEELFFTSPYSTDFPNLFSGHYTYSFPEGYNIKTDYSLIQKDPLPFTLIGLVETVKVL